MTPAADSTHSLCQQTNLAQVIGARAAAREAQETDFGCWYILMGQVSFKGFGVARNGFTRRCQKQNPTAYAVVGTMPPSLRGVLSSGAQLNPSNSKDFVAEGTESLLSVLKGGSAKVPGSSNHLART